MPNKYKQQGLGSVMKYLPQHCIAVSLVTNNDSDGTQIIDAIQLLLLLLHLVVHTPQVLGPARQLLVAEICKSNCVLARAYQQEPMPLHGVGP